MDLTALVYACLVALCACADVEGKQKPGRGRGSMWWGIANVEEPNSIYSNKMYVDLTKQSTVQPKQGSHKIVLSDAVTSAGVTDSISHTGKKAINRSRRSLFGNIFDKVKTGVAAVANGVANVATDVANGVATGATFAANGVADMATDVVISVGRRATGVANGAAGVATDVANGVAGAATDAITALATTPSEAASLIAKALSNIPEPVVELGTSLIPIYGTYKEFEKGNIEWGIFSAVTDVLVICPAAKAGGTVIKTVLKGESKAIQFAMKNLAKESVRAIDPGLELIYEGGRALKGARISSGMSRSKILIKKVARFNKVPHPPLALRGSRSPVWHEHIHNGFYKLGADTSIVTGDVQREIHRLDRLIPQNEKIHVLTGSHGDRFGTNWIDITSSDGSRIFERNNKYLEPDFMFEDAVKNFRGIRKGRIEVIDMSHSEFTFEEFIQYIEGDYHVILAYCYGRNDNALRAFLDLPPVTSYVRKL